MTDSELFDRIVRLLTDYYRVPKVMKYDPNQTLLEIIDEFHQGIYDTMTGLEMLKRGGYVEKLKIHLDSEG